VFALFDAPIMTVAHDEDANRVGAERDDGARRPALTQ